jgi:hypothetical protein
LILLSKKKKEKALKVFILGNSIQITIFEFLGTLVICTGKVTRRISKVFAVYNAFLNYDSKTTDGIEDMQLIYLLFLEQKTKVHRNYMS